MSTIKSFHNIIDMNVRSYQYYTIGGIWNPIDWYITIRQRTLEYQFFPHFHPYVPPLIQRLNDGGVAELQESDTLYLPQPNPPAGQPLQPLNVIPDSTRAMLSADTPATRADGTAVSLTAGSPLTLNDGTSVLIAAGTPLLHPDGSTFNLPAAATEQLPGNLPVSSASGIQWNIAGADTIVPDNTNVTLPSGGQAVLLSDGTTVTLPNLTAVTIRSGLPQPFFYEDFFSRYSPDPAWVQHPYPVKDLDFNFDGAYSIYNWELFFHAPLLIAIHLSQNQKFQDAQNWFHYIFNPMDNSPGPTPERFWKVKPFQYTDVRMIEQILINLSTQQDPELYKQTVDSITNWKQNPFQPFAVAKFRPTSYMLKTVMAYLDNLIAWGDSLFQQYTIETINEATQIYVMAAHILGPKPQPVPRNESTKPLTYNDLRGKLDAFGNEMVNMEVDMPFDNAPLPGPGTNPNGTQILGNIGQTLYFCVPRNDILLGYWDTVADRLFKIHNSLNLQGVFQQLPLYDPPIDPALLVRAAAAGLDVSAIVNGLNQPLPLVRFQLLVAKAAEICQEVKSLGGNILAAIEKQDNESLALLRAQHENAILGLAETVKYAQWQEAVKATQGLQQSLANVSQRYTYYQKLLGRTDAQIQNSIPQLDALDIGSLQNLNFSQADLSSEPQMAIDPINPDISQDSTSVSDGEITTLTRHETEELTQLASANSDHDSASTYDHIGGGLALIPGFGARFQPFGVGGTISFGGSNLAASMSLISGFYKANADSESYKASKAGKLGSYSRREQEWLFQSNSAKGEISQIFKQLRAAQIREAITQNEYQNHKTQMQQAQEIVDFMQGNDIGNNFQIKETTTGFYAWMKREVKALYAKSFQLAFEVAKKAERALQNELGDTSLSYIQFNYLDGTEGLLAGEKLFSDVKTMEMAYHDLNQREYELTRHVSLLQVDPLALVQLRATGSCMASLPEELFDLDCPGHYFRRIKSVAVTIPCVTGPYTGVNCTLSLQNSSIRTSPQVQGSYSDGKNLSAYYGTIQAVVTSSGQMDSGLFETNLHDERYLPFEYSGVISQWQLTLPSDVPQFDFDTITDVVLHIRYTAREGGESMKSAALNNLKAKIGKAQTVGSTRLFSMRHEFPTEWAKFKSTAPGTLATLSFNLLPQHFPFWAKKLGLPKGVKGVQFFAEMANANAVDFYDNANTATAKKDTLNLDPALNLMTGSLVNVALPPVVDPANPPATPYTLYCDNNGMTDLWIAVTWPK